jgi:pimeloyl-ACP methyl ester carboxylesterase
MYAAFLSEIASHGYLVIAPGAPYNRTKGYTNSTFMAKTLDLAQEWDTDDVDVRIDSRSIALAGHSCGGMSTISLASRDPRVTTALVLNSATGKREQLDTITAPSLWIHGGAMDRDVVAVAEKNFAYLKANRTDVAAFKAVMQTGHLGTFWQPRGGLYAETVVHWLNWQLKGEDAGEAFFQGGKASGASKRGFSVDSLNI